MNLRFVQLGILLLFAGPIFAQELMYANRLCDKITVDGDLIEAEWACSELACDFVVSYPNFGEVSPFPSFISLLYDDEALYVAGILYDPNPDSVNYNLSQRDDFGNGDWFSIRLDPYATNQTAFLFAVTAAGVEIDAIEYIDDSDFSWNAVWRSSTKRRDDGWSFEMRIPFSAIRFPKKDVQKWNVNFSRQVRRVRETSTWNPLDPEIYGEITQSGQLLGIESVKSPVRLSFTPYLTSYLENNTNSVGGSTWNQRLTGGMDLKYGVNDAFTIDMTLIPDFGQTRSDNQILNLSPFEIRFNENRPFFLEGMDLFRIGEVFYTRRVGGRPFNYSAAFQGIQPGEQLRSNPLESPLVNASKFSGRTKKGLGIGVFNAIEGHTNAIITDSLGQERSIETNPLTNYNVFVLSQNMVNNSLISFVNTNVMREGAARDANVSVFTATVFSKDNRFKADLTQKNSMLFQPTGTEFGHAFNAALAKVSGVWRYSLEYFEESDTYNPNDLGFLAVNNKRGYVANVRWNDFQPDKYFLRKWTTLDVYYSELYKPQLFSVFDINWSANGTFRNFLTAGINGRFSPLGYVDHFESRTFGKEIIYGPSYKIGGFYSSDYSKPFALDVRASYIFFTENAQRNYSLTVSPRLRFGDRMFLVWNTTTQLLDYDLGYVFQNQQDFEAGRIILGRRDRVVVENSLSGEYIFTNRMGLDIQFRHYWQEVSYLNFTELIDGGVQLPTTYNPLKDSGTSVHNTSYNAFTLDVNYRWVFYPGCELRLVYKNNIFQSKGVLDLNYFKTFETLFDQPQINSISLKVLVFLDAVYFRKKR